MIAALLIFFHFFSLLSSLSLCPLTLLEVHSLNSQTIPTHLHFALFYLSLPPSLSLFPSCAPFPPNLLHHPEPLKQLNLTLNLTTTRHSPCTSLLRLPAGLSREA
jgi:hypothetical protein